MKRLATRLIVVLAAFLSVLLLAEAGLRLAQHLALSARNSEDAEEQGSPATRILCLGDSWTYGMESGDPARLSYPAQLQQILDRTVGKGQYRVTNRGRPGQTSRRLAGNIATELKEQTPSLVILLVGAGNFFQSVGAAPGQANWGLLERSRVAAVIRLLLSPMGSHFSPPSPKALKDALALAISELPAEGNPALAPGTPPLGEVGCKGKTTFATLGERLDAVMGRPPEEMARELGEAAGCQRVLTLAAELCLERHRPRRARHFARMALALEKQDPRARMALAHAMQLEAKTWTIPTVEVLRALSGDYPSYSRVWRLLSLADLTLEPTVCTLRYNLERAAEVCPRCRWVRDALAILEREVALPGQRALEADLVTISTRARLAGSRVLLLNYPVMAGDPCSALARNAVAAAAKRAGVPILELGAVLGECPADAVRRAPHWADGHPNAKGYGYIAEAVANKLKDLGWMNY